MAVYGRSPEETSLLGEEKTSESWFSRWLRSEKKAVEERAKLPPGHPALAAYEKYKTRSIVLGEDHLSEVRAVNGGRLPFVSKKGKPLPKDIERDRMILASLRNVGGGEAIKKGAKLDYHQSKALYETVRHYFDQVDPLMNTERWMADFVERNGIEYTDHDGKRYIMRGGIRKRVG